MVLTSSVRLGWLLQKKIFCNSIKQVSLVSSADVNTIIFWPFWSSCMHKCILLLELRFLWLKSPTSLRPGSRHGSKPGSRPGSRLGSRPGSRPGLRPGSRPFNVTLEAAHEKSVFSLFNYRILSSIVYIWV